MNHSKIRTILFDMGNVLMPFSHYRMCAQIGMLSGLSTKAAWNLLIDSGLQWSFERGEVTAAEFHQKFCAASGRRVEREALLRAGSDIFKANTEILPLLSQLHANGLRLVLMSNTSIGHFEFVRRQFSVLDLFDDFVLSYEVGVLKPAAAMYEAALQKIDCRPQECFYTDDIPAYVSASRAFGFEAEVFTGLLNLNSHLTGRGVI